jgi:hypothetical protein
VFGQDHDSGSVIMTEQDPLLAFLGSLVGNLITFFFDFLRQILAAFLF